MGSRVALVDQKEHYYTSSNPIPVDIVSGSSGTQLIEFQSTTTVPGNTETTVLSFTNTLGEDLFIQRLGGTGDARSEWFIYINTILKYKRRSSVANPNLDIELHGFTLSNGDVIDIKVKHYESSTCDFECEVRYNYG